MSRTLFLYVFKDLVKYFLLAAVALSAIMSFGGLLKPLTKQGLEVAQVGWMLIYLMPAMMTYSLPIAALFATTMIYGRLAADNELTACRASGISYLSMTTPALLLGLTVAIISLLFLCFIVPLFTLQVERVLYSNIAQLVAHQIQREHTVPFRDVTIYADAALLHDAPPGDEEVQVVQLINPTVVTLERINPDNPDFRRPRDFHTARQATAFIREKEDGTATLEVLLEGGSRFPRNLAGGSQLGIGRTIFGPIELDPIIRENSKFMDIAQLKSILRNPLNSREINRLYSDALRKHRAALFSLAILERLNGPSRSFTFVSGDEHTTIQAAGPPAGYNNSGRIVVDYPGEPDQRPTGFIERDNGSVLAATADEIHIGVQPAGDGTAADVTLELHDALLQTAAGPINHARFVRTLRTDLPAPIASDRSLNPETEAYQNIHRRAIRLYNDVLAEIHARVSFAISCLILVMVGCALGILFRSGNFLSAFAVSVIPAVLCVALIVTGQHTAKNIPVNLAAAGESLRIGLILIWSGNIATLLIAVSLLWKLQRQ